jgi:HAMP domain-containing protein
MVPDSDNIMDELQVPGPGESSAEGSGQSLTARALRSLPEGWHAVLWLGEPDEATPARIAELLRSTDSGTAALSHRALDGLRAAYLRIYLDELARPECRPAAGKLGGHVRRALSRRDTRLVSRHLGGCAQCGAVCADLVTMEAVLRGVIAPLILGGTGPYPAAAQPAPAAALAPRLRRAGRGQRRAAVAAGAALALAAVAVVATMLTLNSRPARNARHPAAAGSPAATPPAQPSGRPGSAGPSPSSAAITGLVRPRRTRSAAPSSRPGRGASPPPASTAPLPSSSATLGSSAPPAPSPSPPCLVLPPLRLC